MDYEIRTKINSIRKGKVPVGYKKTNVGIIPCDWKVIKFEQVAEITSSKRIMAEEYVKEGIPFFRSKEIIEKSLNSHIEESLYISFERYKEISDKFPVPQKDDILITAVGTLGVPYVIKEEDLPFYFKDGNLLWMREINTILSLYLYFQWNSPIVTRQIERIFNGSSQKALTIEKVNKLIFPLPNKQEQERITSILFTSDKVIELKEKIIRQKKQQKKWLRQNLLTGRVKIPGYNAQWKEIKLREIFDRVTRKNSEGNTKVLTISAQQGLISQGDFFNKVIASESLDNYCILKKGEFAFNKSYSNGYPMGAIKRLTLYDRGVVTSLYICFKLREDKDCSPEFFEQYFEAGLLNRGLTKVANEGGRAHGLLNITPSDFFNLKVKVPNAEEQKAIADILVEADKEIQILEKELDLLKQQKKGLIQLLLTGKVRVKC